MPKSSADSLHLQPDRRQGVLDADSGGRCSLFYGTTHGTPALDLRHSSEQQFDGGTEKREREKENFTGVRFVPNVSTLLLRPSNDYAVCLEPRRRLTATRYQPWSASHRSYIITAGRCPFESTTNFIVVIIVLIIQDVSRPVFYFGSLPPRVS